MRDEIDKELLEILAHHGGHTITPLNAPLRLLW